MTRVHVLSLLPGECFQTCPDSLIYQVVAVSANRYMARPVGDPAAPLVTLVSLMERPHGLFVLPFPSPETAA